MGEECPNPIIHAPNIYLWISIVCSALYILYIATGYVRSKSISDDRLWSFSVSVDLEYPPPVISDEPIFPSLYSTLSGARGSMIYSSFVTPGSVNFGLMGYWIYLE